MLKKIIVTIVFIILGFSVFVVMQPDDFRITRSSVISAPADKIFAQVNDFHKWEEWSPWAKIDPNSKVSFEGSDSGVGAIMSWDGNMEIGSGSSTIVESIPNEVIKFQLNFLKPMKANNMGEFTFKSEGEKTLVTWSMYGKNNFIGKAMGIILNCEKMVGGMFEQGLTNLKNTVEEKK
ncbi:MAG: SRPBCC family protein [Rickettsiales bacterium]|jgi:hypothetical protein